MSADEPAPVQAGAGGTGEGFLARAARALAHDPALIGAALAHYRASSGLDQAGLAAWLGLDRRMLHGLALCTRPDPASDAFAADVAAIARATGCSHDRLLALLRATADPPQGP